MVFMIIGGFCLIYYIVTIAAAGFSAFSSLIWLGGGLLSTGFGLYLKRLHRAAKSLPRPVFIVLTAVFAVFIAVFVAVEAVIIQAGLKSPVSGADYVIVLGAQVRGEQPSRILRKRVMTAVAYLKENPAAKVVVSGGQGPDEDISEAECMRRVMEENGIDSSRIIIEDKSTNTEENLKFSGQLIGKDKKTVIVTCNFHIYRALGIAKKQGYEDVSGCASVSDAPLLINYYVREFFAVAHYKMTGRI